MDPLHSPRLGRRARYDSFTLPPHFPDPNYSPRRHLPFAPFAPHPSARAPPAIPRDHYDEPQQAFVLPFGDLSYFPSPHRSNPFGFDPHLLHSPRVSDRPIYLGPPNGKPLLPELWERSRGEGGGEDKSRVFDKGPDWFKPYDKFFKLGDPDTALITRRRLESEQDHFLREDSEWKGQRQLRFWDERESRCHDPFLEELPPEAAPLATELPPFSSPRGFHSTVSVNNRGGEASCAFVHRPPPRSPLSSGRSFSELNVVKSTAATVANSKVIGNGTGPQLVQSIRKKKNYVRDVSPDCGFEGRQHSGRKAIKKSYPINVANEVDFWSSYHMVKKTPSIPSMDNEHEFEEDCSTGNSGKRKMVSHGNAKYYAHLAKQPKQKPSAFSRIQSGLSVWERLEEKSLILSPPCSPPCSLSSPPRISNETEAKADTLDLSLKSNSSAAKVIGPLSAEPSFIAKDLLVEKPNRVTKKKSMLQIREKEVIPIVSSSLGSFAKQGVQRNSNVSSFKNVSVLPEANKEVSSCMPGNKSISRAYRKVKKLAVAKKSDVKEASKMASQVESCIIETTRMEDGMEAPKYEDDIKCVTEINNCTHSGYIGTEPIDDNHLQISQKGQMMQVTPTNDVSANIITKDVNQARDIVIEILDDSSADIITKDVNQGRDTVIEILDDSSADIITKDVNQARDIVIEILDDSAEEGPLEIGKKLNNRCRSPLFSDVNDSSQLYDYIIPSNILPLDNVAAQDSSVNIDENDAANSSKQIKPDLESFVNSNREIGQEMLRPNNAASSELLGAVEGFVSVGSRTPYTDNSLNCNGAEIKIDREVKHREKMVFSTTTKELEAPGNYVSSQSCLQGLQAPSFPEISNADPKQKLSCEGTVEENDAHGGNEDQEHWGKDDAFVSSMVSSALEHGHELCKTIKNHQLMSEKAQLVPSHELKKQAPPNPKLTDEELSCKKALPQAKVPRFLSNRPNFSGSIKEAARIGQTGRHRTWHRTNTPLHSDENPKLGRTSSKEVPKRVGKFQNSSYFRKGNSLIRKLATEPPPVFLPTVSSSIRKFKFITESSSVRENRSECPDNATPSHPFFERPRTPPLPHLSKLSDSTMNSCKDFPQLMQVDRSPESDTDQGNQRDCQSKGLLSGNLESQDTASCKTVETVNDKRVTYVKHKMNQLVAAPGPEIGNSSKFLTGKFQIPVHHPIGRSKTVPLSSSYLYYRSKRNQLIRNASSSDSHLTEIPAGNTNSVDSLQQGKSLPLKKRLDNVLHKVKKPTGSSLVWTLGGGKLSQQGIAKLGCQRVFPYIFPWKRAVNWKSYMITNNIPISSRSSVSLISQKLQCMRKRDTIYKVSTNGFSLRKAGVVSIGGSSLKWSKSIENRSKKASEEATMAVAEVERKKRERKRSKSTCGNRKNKVGLICRSTSGIGLKPGERIFRVGSARYKMDSSKRSLLRIPDDHSSSPASQQPDNGSQISFVPRRLVIGNNEYVRIGNGNQLVRDPKKLKRILANEKVRWSLHTARLRLAQKRQYCLFFTRFGKCNKIGGKCPFIHDPTKVAICTKFLKGQCSDINCKLTHKVIPERMPDCSYFLKGLCTNINCPYRHVKVNANAPLCDGFLRGHCADGDECRKKHSYTCPLFEATGKCHKGSLCKLHHPKSPNKSRKRKRTKIQSSSQGRYFYSSIGKAGEPLRVASSQNDLEGGNDIFCSDGRFTEYINLDGDSDNVGINVLMESYPGKLDSGYFDMQSCDMDALIKPVRIMNRDDLSIF